MEPAAFARSPGQRAVSIIVVGPADLEAVALRAVLEVFNYRVEVHWVGAREQFFAIMGGTVPTHDTVALCCHGAREGIVMETGEPDVSAADLAGKIDLPGRLLVSSGCLTGSPAFAAAFAEGGCEAYVAPDGYVEGSAAMFFLTSLFYLLQAGCAIGLAVERARSIDGECRLFALHQPDGEARGPRRDEG